MYDKYSKAAPITTGTQLPKGSKGLLVSTNANGGLTVHFYQNGGITFQGTMHFLANTTNVVPVEVHMLPTALPTGMTAFYLV
jgi:hypothetical protein